MTLDQYLQKNPKKHLIFDFDETLFHLHLPWEIFLPRLKEKLKKIDKKLVLDYKIKNITDFQNKALKKYGKSAKDVICSWSQAFEKDYLKGVSANQKLISWLKTNKNNYRFYIWSSNMKKTIVPVLKKYKIYDLFEKIITKDKVDFLKPYPDGFYQVFNPKTDKKSDFLIVGDSFHDEKAAKSLGIDFYKLKFSVKY